MCSCLLETKKDKNPQLKTQLKQNLIQPLTLLKKIIKLNNLKKEIEDSIFVMDYLKKEFINILHINSNDILENILTKKISIKFFYYFIDNTSNY